MRIVLALALLLLAGPASWLALAPGIASAATLVAPRLVTLTTASPRLSTLPVALDPQTATVEIRLRRPTLLAPLAWAANARIQVALRVDADAARHTCAGPVSGGITTRAGVVYQHFVRRCTLPWGFFGARSGSPRRLGEGATTYRGWVELTLLRGTRVETEIEVVTTIVPAPALAFSSTVAFDAAASANEGPNSDGSLTVSLTTTGSDRGLVAGVSVEDALGSGATVSSVTYAAVTMASEGSADGGAPIADMRSLINPASGANNLVCTLTTVVWGLACGGVSFTGVNQTDMMAAAATATGTSTAPSVDVPSVASGEMVVDIVSGEDSVTVGAGQTQRWNEFNSGVVTGAQSTETGTGTITMSWTLASSTAWGIVAGRVLQATAAGCTGSRLALSGCCC